MCTVDCTDFHLAKVLGYSEMKGQGFILQRDCRDSSKPSTKLMCKYGDKPTLAYYCRADGFYPQTIELLEIHVSGRPVVRFYQGSMSKKLRAWYPKRKKTRQLAVLD